MSYWKGYVVAIASLLAGASTVHLIYKPDLRIPVHEDSDDISDRTQASAPSS